jgi:hypothetical protein
MKHLTGLRGRRTLAVIAALVTGAVIGMGADHLAFAQQSGIKRTMLLRTDSPENPAYEVVMAVAEIAPGASAGKHRHNGIEVGYVLQGSAQLEHEGRATLSLKAGEARRQEHRQGSAQDPRSLSRGEGEAARGAGAVTAASSRTKTSTATANDRRSDARMTPTPAMWRATSAPASSSTLTRTEYSQTSPGRGCRMVPSTRSGEKLAGARAFSSAVKRR